jgi:hypothetical protein
MRPQPDHFDGALAVEDLVNDAVLHVDSAREGAREITDELFEWGLTSEGIHREDFEKELRLLLETGARELARVPAGMAGEDDPPAFHQFSSSTHSESGVFRPFWIDARMPGIESR